MLGMFSLQGEDSCGKRQQLILKNADTWDENSVFNRSQSVSSAKHGK